MGWWPFGTTSSSETASAATSSPPQPPRSQRSSDLLPPTKSAPTPSRQLTQDEQAEAELTAFLSSLEASSTDFSSSSTPSTTSTTALIPSFPPSTNPDGTPNIHPSALRPRSLSCRQLFDSAFYCASLGGKFNDIYRYGSLQPCSEHWDAFWFCMRTKSWGEAERGEAVARWHEEREGRERVRRAGGRSSEDVWEMRTEAVERAFWKVP